MSDKPELYLFDVGVIALAHVDTPVQENAFQYVRDAVAGEIDAIVPRTAVLCGNMCCETTSYTR